MRSARRPGIATSITGPASVAAQELAARIVTLPSPSDRTARTAVDAITPAGRPVILRSLMIAARDAFPHHTT
ncbi:hypothetical protein OHU45_00455 [Streptomyces tubercidicus]|uniref:hypothetical protein n=1 Tax=Streptomyces tubercidicus TaxID=47759 RepID=UPI002E0E93A4|nr:hypothetical protein OG761_00275 [Streptomyces tubercidicus]